ncbi:3-beta hydroxysteroid dehydrogenase [Microbacterium sp. Root61]|uniref:SDR family oxidoreductase n=1 Tax=Microbacterium sp. Root61 TaxID=1736570 RepID=UPI0006FCFD1B|nr:SDR family oxidoreductase [Microbacterium sp. Root61]KRA24411.1 3-beta hydroxysteroid dehydrogenase [Microbacterium sp. Root61]
MKIAVAGGTGTVGAPLVQIALARGHEVTVLSRATGVDLRTGGGLPARLDGIDVLIDVLSVPTVSAEESTAFFSATTGTLLEAERTAATPHHLALSIVGIDRAPDAYYAGKVAQEKLIVESDVPWTILRATQFHEFAGQMFDRAKLGPLHVAPKMRTQPIAAAEVAAHLVDLAEAAPAGRVTDLAGPREESLVEMVRAYARSRGTKGWIPAIGLPGAFGKAQRDGSLLPGPDAVLGTQTFAEWMTALPPH